MGSYTDLNKAIGRLIVGKTSAAILDSEYQRLLEFGFITGIVPFKENIFSLEQLVKLLFSVKEASYHPAIIAVDQEGGAVQRFDHVLSPLPSAMALAAANNLQVLHEITRINAEQLKATGVNCLLTPVLDIVSNPLNPIISTRAFSSSANQVATCGLQVCQALDEVGIVSVGKHFPGHGSTSEDSHLSLATNKMRAEELWCHDLVPFRQCLDKLKAILVGHIWVSAVDTEPLPASLSKRITTNILRERLGFKGLVITDDMLMKAITKTWGLSEAALMAIEAGADLLLICGSYDECMAVHTHLVSAVKNGRLSERRLQESLDRIDRIFPPQLNASLNNRQIEKNLHHLQSKIPQDSSMCLEATLQSICLLRGEIPFINSGEWLVITPAHNRYPLELARYLNEYVANKNGKYEQLHFTDIRYGLDLPIEEARAIAAKCVNHNCIFLTYRSLLYPGQRELALLLEQNSANRIAVAVDTPYDMLSLPTWNNYLATFDPSDLAMSALSQILMRERVPTGICPIKMEYPLKAQ